jgi:hypothetical protein
VLAGYGGEEAGTVRALPTQPQPALPARIAPHPVGAPAASAYLPAANYRRPKYLGGSATPQD